MRLIVASLIGCALVACASATGFPGRPAASGVRAWQIHYRAHNGAPRNAYVLLPAWYGPHNHPPIPLVISPHGRGLDGRRNARLWGQLPAKGGFAVVSPDGQGRELGAYSWGALGQVDDLARMPEIVRRTLPWVRIAPKKVYAFGGSMGGQETLLLLARHPHLLAGAAVFDAVTDFRLQYRDFPRLKCDKACRATWGGPIGASLQKLARVEVGGSPTAARLAWKLRSPITYARAIAASHVPLQFWWSSKDRIVIDQQRQSKRLFDLIRRLNPLAPVGAYEGYWRHSAEMRAQTRLPLALASVGLLPGSYGYLERSVIVTPQIPPPLRDRGPNPVPTEH